MTTSTLLTKPEMQIGRCFRWLCSMILAMVLATGAFAEEFQISLKSGSVITVDTTHDEFTWTKVRTNGEMIKEKIDYDQVQQLVFSESPASEQVGKIRRLVGQLASPDYLERERAEQSLAKPDVGGSFTAMIQAHADHPQFEVRYRVARILEKLDTENAGVGENEFDRLTLRDGTVAEGDAGDFQIQCSFRGRKMSLTRNDIRFISIPTRSDSFEPQGETTQVEMFHNYANHFYQPHQTNIDFELSPNGFEIRRQTNVNDMFIPQGLKLGTEQEGFVGISGYGFKFPGKPASDNSVCVFESVGTYSKRFKGVMVLSFCMPNHGSVAAGVHEVGLLMARVNHSRDFIMEAYNADGQMLASVEASDEPCVFTGVKSNEPIATVRILSNPYLFRIDRAIDEDYAVDSICFSPPVPIAKPSNLNQPTISLRNGDLIQGNSMSIVNGDSVSIEMTGYDAIEIGLDEVQALNFRSAPERKRRPKTWTAMLPDRSTIFVTPGSTYQSTTFPSLKFEPKELMAVWSSQNPARFPEKSDFDAGNQVLVFPTCRIATDAIEFSDEGYGWNDTAVKRIQSLQIDGDEKSDEDPTPDITSIQYAKTWPESIPSLWIHPPKSQVARTGRIRLADGQQLVLSQDGEFRLNQLDKDELTIGVAGQAHKIPYHKILSIEFPNP